MTAVAACRTCGTDPREGARFCDACGSLIAPATEHAEYKQVTVLFADPKSADAQCHPAGSLARAGRRRDIARMGCWRDTILT